METVNMAEQHIADFRLEHGTEFPYNNWHYFQA